MIALIFLLSALTQGTLSSRTASAETTLQLPIKAAPPGFDYVGSIINADSCQTTVGITCDTSASNAQTTGICPIPSTLSVTFDKNTYVFSTKTAKDGTVAEEVVTCTLDGTTAGACTITASVSVDGTATAISATDTWNNKNVQLCPVPITAGVGKLSHSAPCTLSVNAAAPTGLSQVYKVAVVQGAAALLAGALI